MQGIGLGEKEREKMDMVEEREEEREGEEERVWDFMLLAHSLQFLFCSFLWISLPFLFSLFLTYPVFSPMIKYLISFSFKQCLSNWIVD